MTCDPSEVADRCANCGYSLAGIRDRLPCPECGRLERLRPGFIRGLDGRLVRRRLALSFIAVFPLVAAAYIPAVPPSASICSCFATALALVAAWAGAPHVGSCDPESIVYSPATLGYITVSSGVQFMAVVLAALAVPGFGPASGGAWLYASLATAPILGGIAAVLSIVATLIVERRRSGGSA